MAWTGLQFPWKYRPLNEEQKAKFTSHDMPPLEREMNKDAMTEFFTALECTKAYGYDAENDYRGFSTLSYILSLVKKLTAAARPQGHDGRP